MSMYLVAAFVLLVVMLFLVLRPFLLASVEPVAEVGPVPVAPRTERAARPAAASTATIATEPAATTTVTDTAPAAQTDVRASVEAAIAARKAALKARRCPGCDGMIEDGDVFCRSCGTKVSA
jgi:hypothetical protein